MERDSLYLIEINSDLRLLLRSVRRVARASSLILLLILIAATCRKLRLSVQMFIHLSLRQITKDLLLDDRTIYKLRICLRCDTPTPLEIPMQTYAVKIDVIIRHTQTDNFLKYLCKFAVTYIEIYLDISVCIIAYTRIYLVNTQDGADGAPSNPCAIYNY